jgi:hypothetical protein
MEFSVEILGFPVDSIPDDSPMTAVYIPSCARADPVMYFLVETLSLPVDSFTDPSTRTAAHLQPVLLSKFMEFSVEILGFPVDSTADASTRTAAPLPARAGAAHVDLFPVGDGLTHLVAL